MRPRLLPRGCVPPGRGASAVPAFPGPHGAKPAAPRAGFAGPRATPAIPARAAVVHGVERRVWRHAPWHADCSWTDWRMTMAQPAPVAPPLFPVRRQAAALSPDAFRFTSLALTGRESLARGRGLTALGSLLVPGLL